MTLPSTTRRAGPFYGDGAATEFPFTFKTYARSDVQFVVTPASGDPAVLVLDADYTVTLNSDQDNTPGGYVTYPISGSPLPVGDTAAIAGNLTYGQPTDLPDGGAYRARNVETMGDRLGMLIQQLREMLDRALVFPLTDGVPPVLPSAELRRGRLLGFDDDGQFIGVLPTPGDASGLAIDLASTSSGSKGAGLVGFNPALTYLPGTVGDLLANLPIFSVLQYGAVGDGVTDDRAAIQAANDAIAAAGGGRLYFPAGTYRINSQINLSSNIEVYGDGPASIIKQGVAGISSFYIGAGKRGVVVRNLKILGTLVSGAAYTGGVFCDGASYCVVMNVEMQGLTWAGVYLNNAQYCIVQGCRFSGWLGTVQDRADILVYRDSNYNVIQGNFCFGTGADHGILVQDPSATTFPTGNIIHGNQVGEHESYGIAVYVKQDYDSQTVVSNNVVRDILGNSLFGASGMGIYIQRAGGTLVIGNTVSNCCRNTSNFDTLAAAGITANLSQLGGFTTQVTIAGNHVLAQRGPGIATSDSDRAILIEGNTIRSIGTTNVRGEALLVGNCRHAKVHNNTIYHVNTFFQALRMTANDADYSYWQCTNNTVFSSGGGGIILNKVATGTITAPLVSGNTVWCSGSAIAYTLEYCNQIRFTGNHGDSNGAVFTMTNCLGARLSGNRLSSSSGTYSIIFTGMNTGSLCDESNSLAGLIENDPGNGTIISRYGNAAPASSGLWAVGDRVIQSVPVVGNPNGWRCTVAGNPGTWTAEGNLGGGGTGSGSGTYTPTTTNVVNATTITANTCHYQATGDTVILSGSFYIEQGGGVTTQFRLTLPPSLPSALGASLSGTIAGTAVSRSSEQTFAVFNDGVNNEALFRGPMINPSGAQCTFTLTYRRI